METGPTEEKRKAAEQRVKNEENRETLSMQFSHHLTFYTPPPPQMQIEKQFTCIDSPSLVSAGLKVSMVTESGPVTSL